MRLARITRLAADPRARARGAALAAALVAAGGLQLLDANPAVSQAATLTAMRADRVPDLDPGDSLWRRAPEVELAMSAQNVTYPFGGGSVPAVRARALHVDDTLYVRVQWDDPTLDQRTVAAEDFADAVALQFPASAASSAPAICMGQADGGVNIWHWRADSERGVPGSAEELHPDAYVDLYPSTEDLYFPARSAGNPFALPGAGPVQDLVAVGFGTLGPAGDQAVSGRGDWARREWSVVFARPFDAAGEGRPAFDVGTVTDLAVAAWDGDAGDRNGQKSVSQFVQLSIVAETLPAAPRSEAVRLLIIAASVGVLFLVVWAFDRLTNRPGLVVR